MEMKRKEKKEQMLYAFWLTAFVDWPSLCISQIVFIRPIQGESKKKLFDSHRNEFAVAHWTHHQTETETKDWINLAPLNETVFIFAFRLYSSYYIFSCSFNACQWALFSPFCSLSFCFFFSVRFFCLIIASETHELFLLTEQLFGWLEILSRHFFRSSPNRTRLFFHFFLHHFHVYFNSHSFYFFLLFLFFSFLFILAVIISILCLRFAIFPSFANSFRWSLSNEWKMLNWRQLWKRERKTEK